MNKNICRFFLFLIILMETFAMKTRDITNLALKTLSWIEEYHEIMGKYPEDFEDIFKIKLKRFDYDIVKVYKDLLQEGYKISINNNSLIIVDSYNDRKCIYDFCGQKFIDDF